MLIAPILLYMRISIFAIYTLTTMEIEACYIVHDWEGQACKSTKTVMIRFPGERCIIDVDYLPGKVTTVKPQI